ncbi:endonuclease/exonuclease/phosphatase family protein [Myroides pelagicus]|uniref:Endonuclease/exonuclease/phosphatase domain-containing protein n=1 Tax=Myroides pelagicus TaxID=270914 RepID=A0A7K1GJ78_9FLAO|nr:endonuclease/exonuclease/phosphatase family protein [Myroides pelagicus]MTH28483.1 hypothetical protein [Myroides pelagicus]
MKNYLKIFIQLITLLVFSSSCSYQDDFINKNPEKESVNLYSATVLVVDKMQAPIQSALVKLYDTKGKQIKSEETSLTGVALFTELQQGEYVLKAHHDNKEQQANLEIENQDKQVKITLDIVPESYLKVNSPIIITGIQAAPRGSDGAANGTTSTYQGGSIVVHHSGGYEYIQLLALQDIDFNNTPYSLVVANNGIVSDKGWAQGGKATYKFDLVSGSVKKGTFFYVGGKSKVLSGYGSCGKSTDISQANWIATKDYKLEQGDGFGDPTSGLLGNLSKDGQNTADGIAVFKGTQVTSETVPIDAVFYGTTIQGVFDQNNQWGYRIPIQSDRYSIEDKQGNQQPFFGQGTNTHLFSQPDSDVGNFIKLGGATDAKDWLELRSSSIVPLSYCPGESHLSDIESAQGVTKYTLNDQVDPQLPEPLEGQLSIMSFNIRHDDASDPYSLEQRKDYILQLIIDQKVDIVGLQEFSDNWFELWLQKQMAANGYDYYMDEANSYGSPKVIFYKKSRFELKDSQTYQMNYAENRSGSWVILLDKFKNKEYFITNSHWTTVSSQDRISSAKYVLQIIKDNSKGLPVLCIGDFNGQPNSNEINVLKSQKQPELFNALDENLKTFHKWSGTGSTTVDYIFYSRPFTLIHSSVVRKSYDKLWPSDHWPVVATFNIEKREL